MTVIMDPDCAAGTHTNCDGTGWDQETEALADCPCSCHTHVTDAEVEAFKAAWRVAGEKIGRGIAEPGTKTRAGLRAAFAARSDAVHTASAAPVVEVIESWEYGFYDDHKDSAHTIYWYVFGLPFKTPADALHTARKNVEGQAVIVRRRGVSTEWEVVSS